MLNDADNAHADANPAENHQLVAPSAQSRSRRRLVTGMTGGVGVLLAVQAKTALGTTVCQSPSAMVSGNTSQTPDQAQCSGGLSPGYWKVPQHFSDWTAAGAQYPTFSSGIGECGSTGMQGLNKYSDVQKKIVTPGTLIADLFPGANVPLGSGIWAVIAFPNDKAFDPGKTGIGMFMRHLACAWLNAGSPWLNGSYPIRRDQIRDMWIAASAGGVYYPSGVTSGGMNMKQLIAYIEGMYDYNAGLEPTLCVTSSTSTSTSTTATTPQ